MNTPSVTIPIAPSTAALLDAIRKKTEAKGISFDALLAPLFRRVLEFVAIEAHQADLITEHEVSDVLGFENRDELWEFFKRYDVRSKHTREDFEKGRATLASLLAQYS